MDVAEELFANNGFAGSSLRSIIAAAGVNLAAVHYHFHSKEALLEAIIVRRLEPLNQERIAELDACEAQAGKNGPPLEAILHAFIGPPVHLIFDTGGHGRIFGRLMGRLHSETGELFAAIAKKHFQVVTERFRTALQRALPKVPAEELVWRMHFAVGAMAHTLRCTDELEQLSGGICKSYDGDAVPRLVEFLAGGFRAPSERKPAKKRSTPAENLNRA
jgi:AcrR family transcriptional regulator